MYLVYQHLPHMPHHYRILIFENEQQEGIENGYRPRVTEEFQILGLVENKLITDPGGAPYGSVGMIATCPIIFCLL
jgi:hypothetical protein